MHFLSHALLAVSAATLVFGQDNPVVLVGSTANADGGIFQFIPPSFNATNGTTVTFRFTGAPGNHSVTQSTFANPCNPLVGGFDSGWVFIPPTNATPTPEWNLTITNDNTPLWFFCKQLLPLPHCSSGMVGAINAPGTGNLSFSAFQDKAKSVQGPSGQGEGSLVGPGASASTGPGPQASGVTFYTAAPASSATSISPSSPSNTTAPGGDTGGNGGNGAMSVAANSLVVMLGTILGAFVCIV